MRDEIISVTPFEFIDYISIEGSQCIGKHGVFTISGHIEDDKEQEYMGIIMQETWVHVDARQYSGEQKSLFKGIIIDADIDKTNGVCVLTLKIATGSYLMDIVKHTRSYQEDNISYAAVLDIITQEYSNRKYVMSSGLGSSIKGLLLQYNETDWKFARRLASHFGTDIYPDGSYEGTKFYFGIPEGNARTDINTNEYSMVRRKDNTTGYLVETRDIYNIGDWVRVNGKTLWIMEITTKLIGSELYHTCYAINRNSLKIEKKYNDVCIGAALSGSVTAVNKDMVQIRLDKDENADKAGKRWFEYATPYSSPDGSGWYCMPETGDKIQLKIPSENEKEAYVANSVHLESSAGDERIKPDYKSIMNKQGKEILFTPQSLIMTNNAGLSIEILDEEGIKIISNKNITIRADENLEITSANSKLELYARDNVILKQGNTQMDMSGGMNLSGAKLNLN